MKDKIIKLVKKHIKGHTQECTYDNTISASCHPSSDYCTCDIEKRRISLFNDIIDLIK